MSGIDTWDNELNSRNQWYGREFCPHLEARAGTMNEDWRDIKDGKDRFGRQIVPCELCGKPTPMATKRCDGCWELETRIKHQPELARKILDAVEAANAAA